jgi:hydroxyacylglutathione hydrolase
MTLTVLTLPLGELQTNCFIAADSETKAAVVIDPGWDAPRVLATLKERQWSLKYILLTHAHFDHIGAVADLVDATSVPVALHRADLPLLHHLGGAALFGYDIRPSPKPSLFLQPGQVIEVGQLRLEVLFVPGHTLGHVAFYERQANAVFSGDVLFRQGIGRTDFPGGNLETLLASIRDQLLVLPDETTVYPGHGPATTIGAERRDNPFLADL